MDTLVKIVNRLKVGEQDSDGGYFIPEVWNYFGYQDYQRDPARPGEIKVCPYRFFRICLESQILAGDKTNRRLRKDSSPGRTGSFPDTGLIYGMLPRTFTAWNHDLDGRIYPGTFLKAMALLPFLKELGVGIVYLLPVFETGTKYLKGELGSPYAIKNHYRLDPDLHDPLLGRETIGLEEEFKAFVDTCHRLGIKVMVDFVLRTVARDHDLIAQHPEWFYWIQRSYSAGLSMPKVENEPPLTYVRGKALKSLYQAKTLGEHLRKFTHPPSVLDPKLWAEVQGRHRCTGENILTLIEEAFGVTTVPGFSNMLNDPQPPWLDVTYLKLYFDLHREARSCLGQERGPDPDDAFHGYAPFILQDGACANLYQGKTPNLELWHYLIGIIPYYQRNYGIDGARLDMGHALPRKLLNTLIKEVKAADPDFLLWSEEFNPKNAPALKRHGFHLITGSLWSLFKRLDERDFMRELIGQTWFSALPVTAALETPDTPRLAEHHRDKRQIELLVLLSYLLPNTIPFINNGLEILERQPMNLGLDNTEEGRFVLERNDPMYGKLAFFDNYCLHWCNEDFAWMRALLHNANYVRTIFLSLIANKHNFMVAYARRQRKNLLRFGYYAKAEQRGFIFLANRDLAKEKEIELRRELPRPFRIQQAIRLIYAGGKLVDVQWPLTRKLTLAPGEVIIVSTGEEEGV